MPFQGSASEVTPSLSENPENYVNNVSSSQTVLLCVDLSCLLQASVEHMWAIKAVKYAETHFKVLVSLYSECLENWHDFIHCQRAETQSFSMQLPASKFSSHSILPS